MRLTIGAWACCAAAIAVSGTARAGGPAAPAATVGGTCAGQAGCCGHCHAGHDNPCARFAQPNCKPLPPIAFSRYASQGEYDCTRQVFGDAYPRFPWFWYAFRQPYPISHKALMQFEQQGQRQAAGRGVQY